MDALMEAEQRKARSEAVLASRNVPYNRTLPVIETEGTALRREPLEILLRLLCITDVCLRAEGDGSDTFVKFMDKYSLWPYFSPAEKAFLTNKQPDRLEAIQFVWRYEAAWVLMWALGYIPELNAPHQTCDAAQIVRFLWERTGRELLDAARLRPLSQILDETDLACRYHWATTDARVNGRIIPEEIERGVVKERHYALNWLIGHGQAEWDDVRTDT